MQFLLTICDDRVKAILAPPGRRDLSADVFILLILPLTGTLA